MVKEIGATQETYYLRNPTTSLVQGQRGLIILENDGRSSTLELPSVFPNALFRLLRTPTTVEALSPAVRIEAIALLAFLDKLVRANVLLRGGLAELQMKMASQGRGCPQINKVVFAICGTIYAAEAAVLPGLLRQQFAREVEVVLTESAAKFVNPDIFRYKGFRVWQSPYDRYDGAAVPHMYLASSADVVLVLPASARTIHKLAWGECSDLVSLTVAATEAPVVIAPSMNNRMFNHPSIRRNLDRLREDGMYVVEPGLAQHASDISAEALAFSGVGLGPDNLIQGLCAILAARSSEKRCASNPEYSSYAS